MTSYIKCWVLLVVLAVLVEAAPVVLLGHVHAAKIRPAPFKRGKRGQMNTFPAGRRVGFGDKSALDSREEVEEDDDDTGQSEDTSTSVSTCYQAMHYMSISS